MKFSSNLFIVGNNCNGNCYYCYTRNKQLPSILDKHFNEFLNFETYIYIIKKMDCAYVTITGHNCDPIQYNYLLDLAKYLQNKIRISIRLETNGYLLSRLKDSIGIFDNINWSIKGLNDLNSHKISLSTMKDLNKNNNIAISIVVTPENYNTIIDDIIEINLQTNIKKFYLRPNLIDKEENIFYDKVIEEISKRVLDNIEIYPIYNTIKLKNNKINYYGTGDILINKFLINLYEM